MRVEINTRAILGNIEKAKSIVNRPISLMFKDFYEDIYSHIEDTGCKIFSKNLEGSVCYSLFNSKAKHSGCFVTKDTDFMVSLCSCNIDEFYIPINANDNREGLSLKDAVRLCEFIKCHRSYPVKLYGVITSGCLNEKHPSIDELDEIWSAVSPYMEGLSIGGSFWLAKQNLPDYVSDIRIGEYMLFGTIPYDSNKELLGHNSIKIKARVIGVYPERNQIIVDCGYSLADVKDCTVHHQGLKYVDSSSEYTIFELDGCEMNIGEEVEITPNYKSLVKLKDAQRYYL